MKKTVIIAIALSISVSTMAQIKFGVKAGGNMSKLSGMEMGDGNGTTGATNFAYGFHIGGFANYSFNHLFGFQPEVIFSSQGGKYPDIKILNINGGTLRFNYINIPLLLDIKPFKSSFNFLIGPQLGVCVNRSFYDGYVMINKDYKDFDFAIALGIQYSIAKHLALGLRYNYGLIQSLKYDYEYDYEGVKYKNTFKGERNNVLQLSLGWIF
jgi:opacity protein-like surface antigen